MRVVNPNGLGFAAVTGKILPPDHSMTLIVKGTFRLVGGAAARPLDEKESLPVTGDERYDDEAESALRYESDHALFKPRADLLLTGRCHTPGGAPLPVCRATFQVGAHGKSVVVIGDRQWRSLAALGAGTTDPKPFTEMELRYENSFGGPGFRRNPIGKGRAPIDVEGAGRIHPLPNIEDPKQLVTSPDRMPEPAGFGPLDRTWAQRMARVGTYGGDWLKTRWPWFPKDFDWGFFNAAPDDLQVPGYLRGDEELFLENIHPREPLFRGRLPGLRVRCFLSEEPASGLPFREVEMHLDTLWVDAEAERLVLVWRGVTAVRDEDGSGVERVYVATEATDATPLPLEAHRDALARLVAEAQAQEDGEEGPSPGGATLNPDADDEAETDPDAALAQIEMEVLLAQVSAGISPEEFPLPAERSAADLAFDLEFLKAHGFEIPEEEGASEEAPWTRERVQQAAAGGASLAELDLSGLDLTGLDLAGVDLAGALLEGADLGGAGLAGADLTRALLGGAGLRGACLREAVLDEADLTGADLTEADLSGASFGEATLTGALLRGALLVKARGPEARLTRCDLTGADLSESVLPAADLSDAGLDGARFVRANLREASMTGARGAGVDLSGADLTCLRAPGSVLHRALATGVRAGGSIWENADLSEANFTFAELQLAGFSGADLSRADLSAADLTRARLCRATLTGARFPMCNLFLATLEKTELSGADFRGANLYGVELLEAVIDRATNFSGANLTMTKLGRS